MCDWFIIGVDDLSVMQEMGGHVDTLGYCLMHLTLNRDDTWNQERSEFVLDM